MLPSRDRRGKPAAGGYLAVAGLVTDSPTIACSWRWCFAIHLIPYKIATYSVGMAGYFCIYHVLLEIRYVNEYIYAQIKFPMKINLLYLLYFFVLTGWTGQLQAQDENVGRNHSYTIGGNIFRGFIINHTDAIGHLTIAQPSGFEVYINRNSYGEKYWQQAYNYPDVGVSLSYFNYRNEVLGKAVTALGYMDFYLKRMARSELIAKLGTGLVYSTNPYDLDKNNKNVAISTTFSYAMQARLGFNFRLSDRLKITSAVTLTHFSNGGVRLPNKGLNIPSANIGLAHQMDRLRPAYIQPTPADWRENVKLNAQLSTGFKAVEVGSKKAFPFLNLHLYADKRVSRMSALQLGMEGFYNLAYREDLKNNFSQDERPDFRRLGLMAGHELFVGDISLVVQMGMYLYKPSARNYPIYQRYGLKYYLKPSLFTSFSLKTHLGTADVLEFGIGIRR